MTFVYITCKNRKQAVSIAEHLLEKKLIACANIFQVASIYPWKGKTVRGREFVLLCKTLDRNFNKIKIVVKRLHSYEIPLVARIRADANEDYLRWMKSVIA